MSALATTFVSGFGIGASLIIAIGAQNAFVLRQGLRRERVLAVVTVCVICDWALIAVGALGFASLVRAFPAVTAIAAWGGAAFLFGYGAMSFRAAIHPAVLEPDDTGLGETHPPARDGAAVVAAALAVSLLNPHVYLDTVVLLGSIAAQYSIVLRTGFAVGASMASLAWFSTLGFGARLLAPVFARRSAWRVLDAAIGIVMWLIGIGLVRGQLG